MASLSAIIISAFSLGSAIILTVLPAAISPSPFPATILSANIFESNGANVVAAGRLPV